MQRIKGDIEKAGAILEQKNIDIQTVEAYKRLEKELEKIGLTMKDSRNFMRLVNPWAQLR